MGCPKLTYHLTAEPRLRCVYNVADEEENRVVIPPSSKPAIWRIYTEREQPRLYVPESDWSPRNFRYFKSSGLDNNYWYWPLIYLLPFFPH